MASDSRHKILVVDDELLNVELMRAYLEDDYEVLTAYNGKAALELVKNEDPDLILLDVMMPELNGYDVCRIIRNDYQIDFIPIIMVTALTSRDDHKRGIDAGADDFLKKPVSKFELVEKINTLLRIKEQHDNILTDRNKAYDYLDCVGVLVVALDTNYNLIHINKRGLELVGYEHDRIKNVSWIDTFIPADHSSDIRNRYNDLVSGRCSQHEYHEYPIIINSGEERVFRWYDSLLGNKEGSVQGILISGEDVTERKQAEEKLYKYADQLERSNEMKGLFADIMRHDLLNPAGLVQSFAEILESKEEDEKKQQIIQNIIKANAKMIYLIESTASLAKLEAMDEISFVKVDIASVLTDTVENFSLDMANKSVDVDMSFNVPYLAYVNPLIERVFSNLVSNAVKYGAENSTLKIRIADIGDRWKVSITDQGEGIGDADKLSIFERFKRLHKENIRGTGIGLAIVKRIMDLHGEQIGVVDNPEGKGSVFWLTLKKAQ